MTQARELPKDVYYGIQDKAHDLFEAVSDAMDAVKRDRVQTSEWSQLHALLKLAGTASDLACSFALEAPRATDPIPYVLADELPDRFSPEVMAP